MKRQLPGVPVQSYRVWCNQCEALAINGTPCHETGCPNSRQPWKRAFGYCYPENIELPERFKEKETE